MVEYVPVVISVTTAEVFGDLGNGEPLAMRKLQG